MRQEREACARTESFLEHKEEIERFFVNRYAFHNAHLLRASLPQPLVDVIPVSTDRDALHHRLAAELRGRGGKAKKLPKARKTRKKRAKAVSKKATTALRRRAPKKASATAATTSPAAPPQRIVIRLNRDQVQSALREEVEAMSSGSESEDATSDSDWEDQEGVDEADETDI
jgi:hypothetical protein